MALLIRQAYEFLTAIICILTLSCSCDGSLTVKPTNIEAVVGQRVQLNCSTSERFNVIWDHASVRSTSRNYVFFSGVMILPYSQRFQLDRNNTTGRYNLVIPSVQKEDAGNYRCMDMVGHGEQAEAELTVLDSNPQCEADTIKFCNTTSQDFETSCTVGFVGNLIPEMECSGNHVETFNSEVKEKMWDRATYNLQLIAHWPLNGRHEIVCRTSISHVASFVNLTVMYAYGSTQTLAIDNGKTVDCKANSSERCSYQWIHKETNVVISSSQTFTAGGDAGQYTCEATCMLRDQMCVVMPLVANLASQDDSDRSVATTMHSKDTTAYIAVAVCFVVGLILVGVLVTVYLMKKDRCKRSRNLAKTTFSNETSAEKQSLNGSGPTNIRPT